MDSLQKLIQTYPSGRQVRCKSVLLPLTPSSKLAWVGTTDVGSPCTFDSAGVMRLYDLSSGIWMPICDTSNHSRGVSDSWFIISVSFQTILYEIFSNIHHSIRRLILFRQASYKRHLKRVVNIFFLHELIKINIFSCN